MAGQGEQRAQPVFFAISGRNADQAYPGERVWHPAGAALYVHVLVLDNGSTRPTISVAMLPDATPTLANAMRAYLEWIARRRYEGVVPWFELAS